MPILAGETVVYFPYKGFPLRPAFGACDGVQKVRFGHRLGQESCGAELVGALPEPPIGIGGQHDGRGPPPLVGKLLKQIETAHSRQVDIDQQTAVLAGGAGEEIFGGAVGFGPEAGRKKQRLERFAHCLVVINDMYD